MTPADPQRAPRVSDEQVECDYAHVKHYRLTLESTVLFSAGYPGDLRDARARITTLEAENARLTAALASAERDTLLKLAEMPFTEEMHTAYAKALRYRISAVPKASREVLWGKPYRGGGYRIPPKDKAVWRFRAIIRALAPPAVSKGERDG